MYIKQEQWRCLHTPQQHSQEYVLETNFLINYFENPDGKNIDFDCPVIDPNDPEWCPGNSNGEYYRVNCKINFRKSNLVYVISAINYYNF